MKKNIALFLAAALTAGSLTACGGGKDSQTSTTAAKTADQGGGSEQKAPEGGDSQGSSDTVFPAGTLTVPWGIHSTGSSILRPGWRTTGILHQM